MEKTKNFPFTLLIWEQGTSLMLQQEEFPGVNGRRYSDPGVGSGLKMNRKEEMAACMQVPFYIF